jgi:hypothetical protein
MGVLILYLYHRKGGKYIKKTFTGRPITLPGLFFLRECSIPLRLEANSKLLFFVLLKGILDFLQWNVTCLKVAFLEHFQVLFFGTWIG